MQSTADIVGRFRHPQFPEQDQRPVQQAPHTQGAALAPVTHLDVGLSQQCPGQLREKLLALGYCLGGCQVQRCCFPLAAQGGDQSQDAIHEEPVVLAGKGQQRRVEASCSLVVSQGDGRERQAHHQGCRRQYLF